MKALASAGGGFLFAVLWFDLMFDVQARGDASDVPEAALASIAAYYARVTTAARPMNRLVAAAMALTIAAVIAELAKGVSPAWAAWASLAAVLCAVALVVARTVPNAMRLGTRRDSHETQSALATAILRDHVLCAGAIALLLALQVLVS
jgi:hypothetical protein